MTQINVGSTFSEEHQISSDLVDKFAAFSGDYNPIHMDGSYAKERGYSDRVAHGALQLIYLSRLLGMQLPGPGAVWVSQEVYWNRPVFVGDRIKMTATVLGYSRSSKLLKLQVDIVNQFNDKVMEGEAVVKVSQVLVRNLVGERGPLELESKGSESQTKKTREKRPMRKQKKQDLNNARVALISGGSRGIGAAVAGRLVADGYRVVVNYVHDESSADAVVREINDKGGVAVKYRADVGDEQAVSTMSRDVIGELGRCDVVVHAASPSLARIMAEEISLNHLEEYFRVYLGGAISLVNRFSPAMKEEGFGRFVFFGSSGITGDPPKGMASYLIAKEALWGYTKVISAEIARFGITTNLVSPSLTITDLTRDIPLRIKELEALRSPTRRLATVTDSAGLVSFLCSVEAEYINGLNIPVAGGLFR